MVDFKGERRSNATHERTTDPDSRLMRKGNGQPTGYHVKDFFSLCVSIGSVRTSPASRMRKTPGLDGRTMRTEGYGISQRERKQVEGIFGWLKTVDALRKARLIGQTKTPVAAFISAATYNLLRIAEIERRGERAPDEQLLRQGRPEASERPLGQHKLH